MSGVLGLGQLRQLPDGFRQRWEDKAVTSADVQALRNIGLSLSRIAKIRAERRHDRVHRRQVQVVVPQSRAEAQLMNFFKKQDYMAPYTHWPIKMRALAIRPMKDDRTRFLMAMYFTLLGLSPYMTRDWILASGARANGELIEGPYNHHQREHMDRVMQKAQDPSFVARYRPLVDRGLL